MGNCYRHIKSIISGRFATLSLKIFLGIVIGLTLAIPVIPAVQAQPDPVDLVLGGEGATSWNIDNILPCDSGVKTVTLHNAGTEDGFVTIWISDIVSSEGINPESETGDKSPSGSGELDKYLEFTVSAGGLSRNLDLPAMIDSFPQSVTASNYIRIIPLNAGDTVTLNWEWELPCPTGNEVQGDSLSFTINYLLEEFPEEEPSPAVGGGMPVVRCYLNVDMLGEITTLRITCCGNKVVKDYVPTDPNEIHFLVIEVDTAVICGEYPGCGNYPEIIVMSLVEEPPPPPEGMTIIGPVYNFTGYCDEDRHEVCSLVTLTPPITVILSYDPGELPEGAFSPIVAYYDEEEGCWVILPPDTGRVAEVGKVTGLAGEFSLFTVLAELPPPPPPPPPAPSLVPPPPPPPAHFVASDLTIVPSWEKIEWGALTFVVGRGESVTVTTNVGNDGGQEGSYVANLKINGQTRDTKEITLSPGQSQRIVFSILDNEPGHYVVEIGGLSGEFQTLVWVNWWLIAGLTATFILLVWVAWYYGYYRKRHGRETTN